MNTPAAWQVRKKLCSLPVVLCCVGAAWAQQQPPQKINPEIARRALAADTIKKPPVRAQLDRRLVQVQARPAVAFKPFTMVDPHTNKPIAPTAVIALPNGKRPTAKQYYDELNSFEKWLSEHGYSLHTTQRKAQIKLHEVALNRSLIDRQLLQTPKPTPLQRKANLFALYSNAALSRTEPVRLNANHLATARIKSDMAAANVDETSRQLAAANVQGVLRDGMVISTSSLAQLARLSKVNVAAVNNTGGPTQKKADMSRFKTNVATTVNRSEVAKVIQQQAQCAPIHDARNWNWNVGDPSTFAAYVQGSLAINGEACKPPDMSHFDNNQSHVNVTAEGKAGGSVFGIGGEMLRVTGNLGGNQGNGTVSANLGIFVLGQDVFSINKTANGHWGVDDKISKGVDFSTSIPIPVGPFDIDVTVGAQGSVGFEYSMSLYPLSVSLSGGPFVHTNVYAQAGLNVVIAEAGVGASLTLVNWDMNLGGSGGVGWLFGFYSYTDVYGDSNLNLLGGNVYVYAKVYYPCLDPWPDICDSQWQTSLWSWPGLHYNSVLFEEKNVVPLHWQ